MIDKLCHSDRAKVNLFISYRRSDSSYVVDRLRSEIARKCPDINIFRDIESIELGTNFKQAINDALSQCVVLLAVIGPDWLHATDSSGKNRLFDPNDFVRAEIRFALEHNLCVIPVLTERADVPRPSDLPEDLSALPDLQILKLRSGDDFERDVDKLASTLGRFAKPSQYHEKRKALPPFGSLGL
jgi:hypothetical protein